MYRAYGGWTFAFKDYIDLNFTSYIDDPAFQNMTDIIDPYGKGVYINQNMVRGRMEYYSKGSYIVL